jgi:glycosyltransferase involved in cell wall biosynthesis
MRMALSLGFDVSHLTPNHIPTSGDSRDRLESLGVHTIGPPEEASPEAFLQVHGGQFDVVVLSAYTVGRTFHPLVRKWCPRARIIFNAVDMHHIRYEREARTTGDKEMLRRAAIARESELFLIQNTDATIVVSAVEQQHLKVILPRARVRHIPLIRDIPGRVNGWKERANIALVGHYRHAPNPDAAYVFAAAMWPRIRMALPEIHFRMIGAGWPADVPPPPGENIDMLGHVEDLTAELEGLRMTLAPLRFGAGAKGKIVTSLAHGVPCVATPIGAEGMAFTNGTNILIESNVEAFADRVVALYTDEALWNRLSDNGLEFVRRNHSFQHGRDLVRRMMREIGLRVGT